MVAIQGLSDASEFFECPVCGGRYLTVAPYQIWPPPSGIVLTPPYRTVLGRPSYEVCCRCGFEFGNDDDPGTAMPVSFGQYRAEWVAEGRPWFDRAAVVRIDERRRLAEGDARVAMEAGIEILAEAGDSALVLERSREVMRGVLRYGAFDWPELGVWRRELPLWFVEACAPEKTPAEEAAELARWRGLTPEEQTAEDETSPWTVSDWLWWLEPENRTWRWLGAEVADSRHLKIFVDADGAPSPVGALRRLLRAAGADEVEEV